MEIINREGKELETVLNDVCSELNVERNDFYYKYTEKKSGLFNKHSTVSVDIILKNE